MLSLNEVIQGISEFCDTPIAPYVSTFYVTLGFLFSLISEKITCAIEKRLANKYKSKWLKEYKAEVENGNEQ